MNRTARLLALAVGLALPRLAAAQSAELLAPIVGVWQSDTSNGVSAVSSCAWTASHSAVLCDQAVTMSSGPRHALSLFTFDDAAKKFVFYGLGHPGDPMRPVPLAIDGKIWIYGGVTKEPDGTFSRTMNNFSAGDSYIWRQQTSTDGKSWTTGAQGKSVRKK